MTDEKQSWHLSKSVPVALLFAIAMQSMVAVWWASGISSTVTSLEKQQIRQDVQINANREKSAALETQLGRIEEIGVSTLRMVERLVRNYDDRMER